MSDYEIARSYHEAKNKPKQIGILADLTLRSEDDIIKVLEDAGEKVPIKKYKTKVDNVAYTTKWTAGMEAVLRKGVTEHMSWEDIASGLNLPVNAVRKKWYNMNRPKHTPKPQENSTETTPDTVCPAEPQKSNAFGFDNIVEVLLNGEFDTITFENAEVAVTIRRKEA